MRDTIGMGTLVHVETAANEVDEVKVHRKHTMGQTWWSVIGTDGINAEPEGWYSEGEAIAAARRMVKRTD